MQGETIICGATRAWHSLWRNTQQILSRIAAQNRVLYFEPNRNPDRSYRTELWRNLPNFAQLRMEPLHRNLILIATPPCLPYAREQLPTALLQITTPMVARINASILTRHIRWAMNRLKVEAPILWLYEPRHADLVGKFGEKLACYYNYDEMPDFAHNARIQALMRHYDNQLSSRADVVFVSSRGQAERRKQLNPYTTMVPNGVDFDHFHRALAPETRIPPDMASLKKPIVGFIGWMGYQLDIDLLIQIAEACPDYSVALIGPDNIPNDRQRRHLHSIRNVFFLGSKERDLLPAYLKAIQVALIPYKLSGHTLTVYPLKLHEYLAAGRAIVATALPELAPFRQVVRIANTPEEYIHSIRAAMQEYTPQHVAARVAVARENTWDQRVEQIYRVFQAHPKLGGGKASRDESLARPALV